MSKPLDTTCGIYNTEYTLTKHRDGTRTVRAPHIKWGQQRMLGAADARTHYRLHHLIL
jgi:hypothetical protein